MIGRRPIPSRATGSVLLQAVAMTAAVAERLVIFKNSRLLIVMQGSSLDKRSSRKDCQPVKHL
jgi:hypothetical protein